MPSYDLQCKKCETVWDELTSMKEADKVIKSAKCPVCGSKKKTRLLSAPNLKFANPRESSKWDNFGYRAGYTMDEAKDLRRNAEAKSHVGPNPYENYEAQVAADINNDANWGEVK